MPDRSGEPRPGRDEPATHQGVFDALEAKRAQQAAARATLQADYAQEHHDRQAALEARAAAVQACNLCDPDGYRGTQVCDHTDHRDTARRGMAAIRAALASPAQPPQPTPKNTPTGQPDGKTTPL